MVDDSNYKSEEGEMWAAFRKHIKDEKDKRVKYHTEVLEHICRKHGYKAHCFNTNSWRISSDGKKAIDYYPPSSRVFFHSTKKWSRVKIENLENTILNHFNNVSKNGNNLN
jgi:hypothetical protein